MTASDLLHCSIRPHYSVCRIHSQLKVYGIVRGINVKRDLNHSRLRRVGSTISHMETIPAVEIAKSLMTDAVTWSVMKWLREKKTVRKIADQANAALDQMNQAVKDRWPDEFRAAYETLVKQSGNRQQVRHQSVLHGGNSQALLTAKKVKEADDQAYDARMDAEQTFDTAEKQLSTALAREGCRKAIRSWELHETAIRKAEAIIPHHSNRAGYSESVLK